MAESPTESTREDLELKKLQLEVQELRNWWQRPAYVQALLSVIVSIIVASATVLMGYVNGFFDVQRGRLEIQRAEIRQDIQTLEAGRSKLQKQISDLTTERDHLKDNYAKMQSFAGRLEQQAEQSAGSLRDMQNELRGIQAASEKYHQQAGYAESRYKGCVDEVTQWRTRLVVLQQQQQQNIDRLRTSVDAHSVSPATPKTSVGLPDDNRSLFEQAKPLLDALQSKAPAK